MNRETQLLGQAVRPFFKRLGLPAPTIRRQSEAGNVRQGFFERAAFEKVRGVLPAHLQDAALFAYLVGWRKGEIESLGWADVDREGGVIRLRPEKSKNGRGRTLVLAAELTGLIERRRQARQVEGPDGTTRVTDLVPLRRSPGGCRPGTPAPDVSSPLGARRPRGAGATSSSGSTRTVSWCARC